MRKSCSIIAWEAPTITGESISFKRWQTSTCVAITQQIALCTLSISVTRHRQAGIRYYNYIDNKNNQTKLGLILAYFIVMRKSCSKRITWGACSVPTFTDKSISFKRWQASTCEVFTQRTVSYTLSISITRPIQTGIRHYNY